VQKGGQIQEAMYPRTFSLHGQEYALSLFFHDLSKLFPEIKMSCCDCISFPSSNDTKLYFYHFHTLFQRTNPQVLQNVQCHGIYAILMGQSAFAKTKEGKLDCMYFNVVMDG
jgi:DUF438 domain-containing protein